jgi:5'-3' exonuclease
MGIRNLNRFLVSKCSKNAIHKVHLKELKDKIIVVDASIYIYKFIGEKSLIENIYLLVSIFRYYAIIPVFIFDGKPPEQKKELLQERRIRKREAELMYYQLKESITDTMENIQEIQEKMEMLEKQFVRVSEYHIRLVKDLLKACGVEYYNAEGESDELCAKLVLSNKAWACLSEDMDMFVYGCPRVLRQVSLMNHTCMFYDTQQILKELEMSEDTFREITVISGTDYNFKDNTDIYKTIKWYYEYQEFLNKMDPKMKMEWLNQESPFYQWLEKNTKYIPCYSKLQEIYQMFSFPEEEKCDFEKSYQRNFQNRAINEEKLKKILEIDGFIY